MNPPDMQPPVFSISIVSYNTRDLLRTCLGTVAARQAESEVTLEVIVADNGSTDGSAAMVREEFPWVRLVETGGNIGYGLGNNRALEEARGRYFVILNSDTEVQPGALAMMRDFLDTHPEAGAVGAHLILPNGDTQPSCVRDPGLLSVFWEQTYLNKLLPISRTMGTYPMAAWAAASDPHIVDTACGACLCVRREAYRQISGFDPAYFMYFEDIDLCVRLRAAGWKIYFVPGSRIHHLLGASSSQWQSRARMIVAYNESRYYYFSRTRGRAGAMLLKALVLMGAGLRLLSWSAFAWRGQGAREQLWIFQEVWRKTWRMAMPSRVQQESIA